MDIPKTVQDIQYVLAPAVMVSSSALLLLGFQNKFSNLANRFRALNHEERLLQAKPTRDRVEQGRLDNLTEQIRHLIARAKLVKNAILSAYAGIACFSGTSILIFVNLYTPVQIWTEISAVFIAGILCVLASAFFMIGETRLFYRVIDLENRS